MTLAEIYNVLKEKFGDAVTLSEPKQAPAPKPAAPPAPAAGAKPAAPAAGAAAAAKPAAPAAPKPAAPAAPAAGAPAAPAAPAPEKPSAMAPAPEKSAADAAPTPVAAPKPPTPPQEPTGGAAPASAPPAASPAPSPTPPATPPAAAATDKPAPSTAPAASGAAAPASAPAAPKPAEPAAGAAAAPKPQAPAAPKPAGAMVNVGDGFIKVNKSELIPKVMELLRDDPRLAFDLCHDVSGLDQKDCVEIVYHLNSLTKKHWVVVKTSCPRANGHVPTVAHLWKTAIWHEREAYDLFGVKFDGHPDMRRILLPDDWEGHPLLKDYKVQEFYRGMPVPYHEEHWTGAGTYVKELGDVSAETVEQWYQMGLKPAAAAGATAVAAPPAAPVAAPAKPAAAPPAPKPDAPSAESKPGGS